MDRDGQFADFDTEVVYYDSQERALSQQTQNFVVEFGKDNAHIAFDYNAEGIKALVESSAPVERPVRWM